jgi:hypothetical protein
LQSNSHNFQNLKLFGLDKLPMNKNMKKYHLRFLISLITVAVMINFQVLQAQPQAMLLPMSWHPSALTQRQIREVKECDLKNIVKKRYSEAAKSDDLLSIFTPKSACDWAVLALAYAERTDQDQLPEAAKIAFSRAVSGNLGFALAMPLFYRYFGSIALVKAPPQMQQEITAVEIEYRWSGQGEWMGLGVAEVKIEIDQANTRPNMTLTEVPRFSQSVPMGKVTSLADQDKQRIQTLASALTDLLPIKNKFQLTPCSDNYPNWAVKLTFADKTILRLTTDSNFLSIGGPWFTEIEDQNYIQFSPAFAKALGELCTSLGLPTGQPVAMACFRRQNVLDLAYD